MDIPKKLAHAAEKFGQSSPRKKSFTALDYHGSEESDPERGERKLERKNSAPSLRSSSSPSLKKKKSKKKLTLEEDLASAGCEVTPKMLAMANISKKHALRNEIVMLNYVNALSDQLCAQEQAIQIVQVQLKQLLDTQKQRDLEESSRRLHENQLRRHNNDDDSDRCLSFFSTDEECTLF